MLENQQQALPESFRQGDWLCSSCNAHNYASKNNCFKCGTGKEGTSATRPENFREGDWICPVTACNAHNYQSKSQCFKCGISKALAGSGNAPKDFRQGDWMCPICSNHNYASKSACVKCNVPKMMLAAMGGGMGGGYPHAAAAMGHGGAAGFRQGDWMCMCGNHNYANKSNCNKCGLPKQQGNLTPNMGQAPNHPYGGMDLFGGGINPMLNAYGMMHQQQQHHNPMQASHAMGNFRQGDWMCPVPTCSAHNYQSKTQCFKCGTAKPAGGVVPQNFRQGDWICSNNGCGNHNFASKTACHRCQAPKPASN